MSFDADLIACAQLVEKGDPDRFAATMAAPVAARKVLFPIYAFNVEVSRAPWVTKEAIIAEMRLQWWTDALEEIASGGLVRRHEVVTSLAHVLDEPAARELQKVVQARLWDVYRDPFEDQAAFSKYIEDTAASLLRAASQALSGTMPDTLTDLGYASGLAQFLRAVPELERQGRRPLVDGRPEAVRELERQGRRPLVDGRPEAVRELAQQGFDRLVKSRKARSGVIAEARPITLTAWQAGPLLKQAKSDPRRVANGTLGMAEAYKKLRLVWCAATGRW